LARGYNASISACVARSRSAGIVDPVDDDDDADPDDLARDGRASSASASPSPRDKARARMMSRSRIARNPRDAARTPRDAARVGADVREDNAADIARAMDAAMTTTSTMTTRTAHNADLVVRIRHAHRVVVVVVVDSTRPRARVTRRRSGLCTRTDAHRTRARRIEDTRRLG